MFFEAKTIIHNNVGNYMKPFLIFSFLIFYSSTAFIFPQTKDTLSSYYYKRGLTAISSGNMDDAKGLFKKSIRKEENGPSEYELAKIYEADTSHSMWNISREHIKKAVKLEPNNITYRLFYGTLSQALYKMSRLEFNAEDDAIKQYEKVLELDSSNFFASKQLGKIKAKEFLKINRTMTKYDNSQGVNNATEFIKEFQSRGFRKLGRARSKQLYEWKNVFEKDLDEFTQKDFKYAVKALNNAIKYDSLNPNPYLLISSIFEDNDKPEKGIPYLQKLVRIYPDNKEAHLNLGLLYYRNNQVDSAYFEYQKALNLMSDSERTDFTYNSVKILLDPYLKNRMNDIPKNQLKNVIYKFWKSRDPLYLTPYNERLLEHYTRVTYANLRFSVPGMGIIGWKTDRGITVIKYGIPPIKFRYRAYLSGSFKQLLGNKLRTEVWVYGDKTFGFTDQFRNGNYQFSKPGKRSQYWDDTQDFIENLKATQPDSYTPVFKGPQFYVPYKAVQFKDLTKNNLTDIYVSYGLQMVEESPGEPKYKYIHKTGVTFFDKYLNKIVGNEKTFRNLNIQNEIEVPDSGNLIINSLEIKSPPDSGNFSFEIIRDSDKGVATYHGRYKIRNFDTGYLSLSDVLLASKVEVVSGIKGRINREKYSILPNPTRIFSEDQNLYIYYEVYNLGRNPKGLTNFKQSVILQKQDDKGAISKIFFPVLKLIGIDNEEKQVSLTSNYQTKDKDSEIYLQLDMNSYEPGNYILTIKIKDNISGKETGQNTKLTWR